MARPPTFPSLREIIRHNTTLSTGFFWLDWYEFPFTILEIDSTARVIRWTSRGPVALSDDNFSPGKLPASAVSKSLYVPAHVLYVLLVTLQTLQSCWQHVTNIYNLQIDVPIFGPKHCPSMHTQLIAISRFRIRSTSFDCFDLFIYPTNQPTNQPTYLPTYQPTNLPTYQPTSQPTNEPTYKLEMQLRLFSQKSKKTGIPSPIFGWKKQWKTTVSYGFLMFLVDFYFKPVLEMGGLSWTTALRRTCRKPQRSGGQFCELEGQVCRNSLVFGTKNMCMLSFFYCIQSQFIGFSCFSGDCSWRPVEFGRNRNNNTQNYILRYLSYIQ